MAPTRLLSVALAIAGAACAAGSRSRSPAAPERTLALVQRVEHVDTLAREAMVVERRDGTLFVAGYGGVVPGGRSDASGGNRSRLWRSTDHGATWSQVDPGPDAADKIGNSDVDLALAPDGTLYFASMLFVRGEGRRIAVGVTRDGGASWTWTVVSEHRFDDRPWVKVAPDGAAHVIWNDGSGVYHVASRDHGATWSQAARLYDHGGSSHLAVGPQGELAVRITPASASYRTFDPDVNLIAVSTDGGESWRTSPAPNRAQWAPPRAPEVLPRWVEPLAWDGAGRLYSLWTDTMGVWLARSNDRGGTWSTWRIVEDRGPAYYPYLVARGDGDLAATWMSGTGDALHWELAHIVAGRDTDSPRVVRSAPQELKTFGSPDSTGKRRHGTGGEYIGLTFLRDGGIGVATALNDLPDHVGFTWWRFQER